MVSAESPSSRLLGDRFRIPVEQVVSEYFSARWTAVAFTDMHQFASHPAAVLSNGTHSVFVKLSEAAHGLDQFESEVAGLRLLSEASGVLTPPPIGIVPVDGGSILVLEAAEVVERTPRQWREIGHALARIHQVKSRRCGSDRQCYFGPLYQDNRPLRDWLPFFTERRLWPRLAGAIDSGNLPTEVIGQVEKMILHLPDLGIPETEPALLHGDAQKNNFISTSLGAMCIDPAVHFGNPELDLAHLDYFEQVPDEVFTGYQELMPIDPGFWDRRELWRMPTHLALVTVGGPGYLPRLANAIRRYL